MITYNPPVTVLSKEALLVTFKGKRVSEVQTPNLIIDRKTFIANCKRMQQAVSKLEWDFRAHVKTHKTVEGALLQCEHTGTNKLCASTLPEMYDSYHADGRCALTALPLLAMTWKQLERSAKVASRM